MLLVTLLFYINIKQGISNLIYDNDDLLNGFLQSIAKPSEVSKEDKLGEYLKCEHNREEDSYRYNYY